VLLDGLQEWMSRKGFTSLSAVRGLLAKDPEGEPAYGRAGYLSAIEQATAAYGCPGSHQAAVRLTGSQGDDLTAAYDARRPRSPSGRCGTLRWCPGRRR
jgi:hypothetical protein